MGPIHVEHSALAIAAAAVLLIAIGWALRAGGAPPRRARRTLIILRGLLLALVLLAASEPTWQVRGGPRRLVVLADRSASMPPQWASRILADLSARLADVDIRAYRFAGQAQPIDPHEPALPPADPADGSDPSPAIGLSSGDDADATLLLTDGNWTARPTWPASRRLWAMCPTSGRANAGLIDLVVRRIEGNRLMARATLLSTRDGAARLRLGASHSLAMPGTEQQLMLTAGTIRTVDWLIPERAVPLVRAELEADWDELAGDNQLTALAEPPPDVRVALLVTTQPAGATADLLARLPGWQVLPWSPMQAAQSGLLRSARPPAVVVLDDLPAADLAPLLTQGDLPAYLNNGGSLLTLGGPASLGAGHYYDSPIEALLPVQTRPRSRPPTAIALVLDRSGSMSEPPASGAASGPDLGGISKLDLLKQAVLALSDLFAPGDRLAVIGFADQAKVLYDSRDGAIDWQAVRRAMVDLTASGGTVIEPAMRSASDWLTRQDVPRRHLLLLSDGKFTDQTVEQATAALAPAGKPPARLTVSTFAASDQAERRFLEQLAGAFDGLYYRPSHWGRLREQFRDDLAGATVSPRVSGPLTAEPVGDGPRLPDLAGVLTCEPRPRATVWYTARPTGGEQPWPLVIVGSAGAGRSGVLATSLAASWTPGWSDADRAALLRRVLTDLAGAGDDPRVAVQVAPDLAARAVRVELYARTPGASAGADQPINLLDLSAEVVGADGKTAAAPLRQTGPGRYTGSIDWRNAARLLIVERAGTPPGRRIVARRALSAPLPAELLHLDPQPQAMDALCRAHGGRLLETPDGIGQMRLSPSVRSIGLWPWLLLAAVVAWLAEVVASRRNT